MSAIEELMWIRRMSELTKVSNEEGSAAFIKLIAALNPTGALMKCTFMALSSQQFFSLLWARQWAI